VRRIIGLTLAGLALSGAPALEAAVVAPSLRGSPAAMQQQNRVAKEHGLTFYRTTEEIRAAVGRGDLVELEGNADYAVADFVRLPYVQPELLMFVERLSAQYRASCGQRLVVTSAVRPSNGQPSNAHALSVHPAGMALDLRVSDRASCRSWLEGALLGLERRGVLNGIREFRPPHYHVAVFPEQYMEYVAPLLAAEAEARAIAEAEAAALAAAEAERAAEAAAAEAAALAAASTGTRTPLVATIMLLLAIPVGRAIRDRRRGDRRAEVREDGRDRREAA
jgi:hypothetical protein